MMVQLHAAVLTFFDTVHLHSIRASKSPDFVGDLPIFDIIMNIS